MKNNKGITLIALIITIIVMLILVGVTVTIVLNGGLFNKTKYAAEKTEIEIIKEQALALRTDKMAENNGNGTDNWDISIDDLNLPESTKQKYKDKIIVNNLGELEYDPSIIKGDERKLFDELGIICIDEYFTYERTSTELRVRGFSSLGLEKLALGKNVFQIPSERRDGVTVNVIRRVSFQNYEFEELILPDTITSIADSVFDNSKFVIRIPESVTSVGYNTFAGHEGNVYVPFTQEEGKPAGWHNNWARGMNSSYIIYKDSE